MYLSVKVINHHDAQARAVQPSGLPGPHRKTGLGPHVTRAHSDGSQSCSYDPEMLGEFGA